MSTVYHILGIDSKINDMFLQEIKENDIENPEIFLKSFWLMISKACGTNIYQEHENEFNCHNFLRYVIRKYKNNDPKIIQLIDYGKQFII